jgi:hypothetical protein
MANRLYNKQVSPKGYKRGGHVNTGRMNLLEEVGRIDAERPNRNRRAEKRRVISELKKGYEKGGKVKKYKKFKEPGGGGWNKPGPHKVHSNRRTTESMFGHGKLTDAIVKIADKHDKPVHKKWKKNLQKQMDSVNKKNRKKG